MCLIKQGHIVGQTTYPGQRTVYKVLLEDDTSPFLFQKYHRGMNVPDKEHIVEDPVFISGGYLHAYTSKYAAEYYAMKYQQHRLNEPGTTAPVNVKVVEMYIPEGTEYWMGINSDIATKKLYWPEENNDQ